MPKRMLLSGLAILIAWTVLDVLLHRLLLRPVYQENADLWRPFEQMNVALIYVVTFTLIATFVATYRLLVRPKSLGAGVRLGAFVGLALGISAGLGTYIHMPIPPALAWGWLIGGWLKGIAAGFLRRSARRYRATVAFAALATFVLGYAAAWFLFNLGRMPPYIPGAVTDPTIAPPQAVAGLAVVASALVLPGSALACALAFRLRGWVPRRT